MHFTVLHIFILTWWVSYSPKPQLLHVQRWTDRRRRRRSRCSNSWSRYLGTAVTRSTSLVVPPLVLRRRSSRRRLVLSRPGPPPDIRGPTISFNFIEICYVYVAMLRASEPAVDIKLSVHTVSYRIFGDLWRPRSRIHVHYRTEHDQHHREIDTDQYVDCAVCRSPPRQADCSHWPRKPPDWRLFKF